MKIRNRNSVSNLEFSSEGLTETLSAELGAVFSLHTTAHFCLAVQAAPVGDPNATSTIAQWAGNLLEVTYTNFLTALKTWTLAAATDLGVIIFTHRKEFHAYNRVRGVSSYLHDSHSGYYCPRRNHVVLLLEPDHGLTVSTAWGVGENGWLEAKRCHVVHESVHLLCFNCGLLERDTQYPWWVVEGIAVCFEAAPPGSLPFSLESTAGGLLAMHLREMNQGGHLLTLDAFLPLVRPPRRLSGVEGWQVMYCQGWGLFHFMYSHYRDELAAFIGGLSKQNRATRGTENSAPQCHGCAGDSGGQSTPERCLLGIVALLVGYWTPNGLSFCSQ
eukprot:CAMPEP_0117648242 /NCGR_PEP_ID=MMETSP0804-20121206/288_1 /TAXON_ID=1074897 /ORGANISM="Tetraselmis astigmatica, Strain CCMP880" /LENGTH=329 /DNA_ID=CAMNT_0005453807 /DNA_START=186 /DNA_END=1176 /DNA_ORIENTATION=-